MSKLSCEVIRDLLSSYIEGSCSNNTKELVEEHKLECKACSERINEAKAMEMPPCIEENMELHSMKNVKSYFKNRDVITLGSLIGLIAIIMVFAKFSYGAVPLPLYYFISPICVLACYYMLSDHITVDRNSRWKAGMSIVGVILVCYSIFLMIATIRWVETNRYPLGLSENNLGPFVYNQLLAIAIILIAITIRTIYISEKTKNSHGILLDITITGSWLALLFITMMKSLNSVDAFVKTRNNTILILVVESLIMAVLIFVLNKRKFKLKHTLDNS